MSLPRRHPAGGPIQTRSTGGIDASDFAGVVEAKLDTDGEFAMPQRRRSRVVDVGPRECWSGEKRVGYHTPSARKRYNSPALSSGVPPVLAQGDARLQGGLTQIRVCAYLHRCSETKPLT